ncbi:MAG: hypothetical protein IPL61_39120 [Myxococcales bacterium]|nr:hypothetical protein [Myxococcales bacterium]
MTALIGEAIYDDGFVAYLNGVELGRASMPAGPITAATLAPGSETGNNDVTLDWTAGKGLLVAGPNVLAVEVHQAAPARATWSSIWRCRSRRSPPHRAAWRRAGR